MAAKSKRWFCMLVIGSPFIPCKFTFTKMLEHWLLCAQWRRSTEHNFDSMPVCCFWITAYFDNVMSIVSEQQSIVLTRACVCCFWMTGHSFDPVLVSVVSGRQGIAPAAAGPQEWKRAAGNTLEDFRWRWSRKCPYLGILTSLLHLTCLTVYLTCPISKPLSPQSMTSAVRCLSL